MLIHELKAENRSGPLSTQQKLNLRRTAHSAVRSTRRKQKCEMLEPNERLESRKSPRVLGAYDTEPSGLVGVKANAGEWLRVIFGSLEVLHCILECSD
jgi:hypothetical protein